ncbi:MAG: methionine gamma-lyase family protein [Oscillospiraceae bacterium]|nr:methionine gamma-lyase family protein [Oscillospiraceae bacterium]
MSYFQITDKIRELSEQAMSDIEQQFKLIDKTAQTNTEKVLAAFQRHNVSDTCFAPTSGYGYNDKGREVMDLVFADTMSSQYALVRTGFVNGTHAITNALFAALRPGQTLLAATGLPYDTLHGVIGLTGNYRGSLKDYDMSYSQVDLLECGTPDIDAIVETVREGGIGAVLIQRSRGYSSRRAVTVKEIGEICKAVKAVDSSVNIFVDNCYGEFVEAIEPGDVGVDIFAGSLIKGPGGGLAPRGGYICGREDLVDAAAYRLTSPGIGGDSGASPEGYRLYFQGLFMAPHTVAQALKTAVFCARLLELLGYKTFPKFDEFRSDIVQVVQFGEPSALERFCRGIQKGAPVDSYVTPIPSDMPGYDYPVIMAAGAFVQGATIELSADGPMREPYNAYLQGGLTFESGKLGIMLAAGLLDSR